MNFIQVSLFPEIFAALTEHGVTGRAFAKGLVRMDYVNPRVFAEDVHRTVDDRPYGGGPGMVMMAEPLTLAVQKAKSLVSGAAPKVVYVSPQGKLFNQQLAQAAATEQRPIIWVSGRYEGLDERFIESTVDEEWSLGDFVLSGGELAAMAMMDAIIRLLPGALGHEDSAAEDSFSEGLLDCPHYTRPDVFMGGRVPDVLLSGHHQNIRQWRLQQSLGRTWQKRPDLLAKKQLTAEEQRLLAAFQAEQS